MIAQLSTVNKIFSLNYISVVKLSFKFLNKILNHFFIRPET